MFGMTSFSVHESVRSQRNLFMTEYSGSKHPVQIEVEKDLDVIPRNLAGKGPEKHDLVNTRYSSLGHILHRCGLTDMDISKCGESKQIRNGLHHSLAFAIPALRTNKMNGDADGDGGGGVVGGTGMLHHSTMTMTRPGRLQTEARRQNGSVNMSRTFNLHPFPSQLRQASWFSWWCAYHPKHQLACPEPQMVIEVNRNSNFHAGRQLMQRNAPMVVSAEELGLYPCDVLSTDEQLDDKDYVDFYVIPYNTNELSSGSLGSDGDDYYVCREDDFEHHLCFGLLEPYRHIPALSHNLVQREKESNNNNNNNKNDRHVMSLGQVAISRASSSYASKLRALFPHASDALLNGERWATILFNAQKCLHRIQVSLEHITETTISVLEREILLQFALCLRHVQTVLGSSPWFQSRSFARARENGFGLAPISQKDGGGEGEVHYMLDFNNAANLADVMNDANANMVQLCKRMNKDGAAAAATSTTTKSTTLSLSKSEYVGQAAVAMVIGGDTSQTLHAKQDDAVVLDARAINVSDLTARLRTELSKRGVDPNFANGRERWEVNWMLELLDECPAPSSVSLVSHSSLISSNKPQICDELESGANKKKKKEEQENAAMSPEGNFHDTGDRTILSDPFCRLYDIHRAQTRASRYRQMTKFVAIHHRWSDIDGDVVSPSQERLAWMLKNVCHVHMLSEDSNARTWRESAQQQQQQQQQGLGATVASPSAPSASQKKPHRASKSLKTSRSTPPITASKRQRKRSTPPQSSQSVRDSNEDDICDGSFVMQEPNKEEEYNPSHEMLIALAKACE